MKLLVSYLRWVLSGGIRIQFVDLSIQVWGGRHVHRPLFTRYPSGFEFQGRCKVPLELELTKILARENWNGSNQKTLVIFFNLKIKVGNLKAIPNPYNFSLFKHLLGSNKWKMSHRYNNNIQIFLRQQIRKFWLPFFIKPKIRTWLIILFIF